MPRGYSPDLRERVLLACEEEGLSAVAAARRDWIGERTVHRWRQVARQEGRRQAKPHAGGRQRVVVGTEEVLRELVAEGNDATLAEQADAYQRRTDRGLSPAILCRAFQRLGLRRKKEDLARRGARASRPSERARRFPERSRRS